MTEIKTVSYTHLVNESNLYKTIFKSRKEAAERFTDWVTSEVLPAIRKTGSYHPMYTDEKIQVLAQGNIELNEKVDNLNKDLHCLLYTSRQVRKQM